MVNIRYQQSNILTIGPILDEASLTKSRLMIPWKELVSIASKFQLLFSQRTIENAFDVLMANWRLPRKLIIGETENIMKIVKAMCVLHNIEKMEVYTPAGYVDNEDN